MWSRTKQRQADYGHEWRQTRSRWAAAHHPADLCTRCRHPLGPMGPDLHLDHDDHDRSIVRGFAHAACNVSAAGRLGRDRQRIEQNANTTTERRASTLQW